MLCVKLFMHICICLDSYQALMSCYRNKNALLIIFLSVADLEGWEGERDGREVRKGGDIRTLMANSC